MAPGMAPVPDLRVRTLNDRPVEDGRGYVLYWMTAFRRAVDNFALQRAVEHAKALGKPLVVFEALRVGYRWANHRHHRFVLQGMADNRAAFEGSGALYRAYVEPEAGAGKGLLAALAEDAAVVVTDDWPCFFVPRMQAAAAERLDVRLEAVDSNGLYPIHAAKKVFSRAFDFRRHLQKNLAEHLLISPTRDPLARADLPAPPDLSRLDARWPEPGADLLAGDKAALDALPIDDSVATAAFDGGTKAAEKRWKAFLQDGFEQYGEGRNHPDDDCSSGLSPWLHFGHISTHRLFADIAKREGWAPSDLSSSTKGAREGWWGMSAAAESFLDELITWRELGLNMCAKTDDYDRFESLPDWAQQTIEDHASDPRPETYDLEALELARTSDDVWNAAQRQLVTEGRMHNYLRMLWGKRIYEWSEDARTALDVMIHLNNKYAVDGRDPNSYSGIFWVLGRYDRAWGPERPIFGKLRYMTSDSTRKKLRVKRYLERYGSQPKLL